MRAKTEIYIGIRNYLRKFDIDITHFSYGKSLAGRLKLLLREKKISCALDVGANVGQFALSLREFGFTGKIISFEPAIEPFNTLKSVSAGDSDWHVEQIALGSSDGAGHLKIMDDSRLTSFHSLSQYGATTLGGAVLDHVEDVSVMRLDSLLLSAHWLTQSERIFLKIDTQGNDLEVFRGATGCLSRIAVMQMELSVRPIYDGIPNWHEVIREVEDAGFGLAGLFPVNHDPTFEVIEFDGLFINRHCSS